MTGVERGKRMSPKLNKFTALRKRIKEDIALAKRKGWDDMVITYDNVSGWMEELEAEEGK